MANLVYNDLTKSPFKINYDGYTLYFSSVFHRNKFNKNIKEYIKEENIKFCNRYKVKVDLKDIFILSYYKKCESRGFRVFYQGIKINKEERLKNIIL